MKPIKLQEWANENKPSDTLIYKDGYWEQIIFIRDQLSFLFVTKDEHYDFFKNNTTVISTHTSKSVLLPVFSVLLPNRINLIMRYNFHDWKISVNSELDIEYDFADLFNIDTEIHSVYCEGFSDEWIYEPYSKNKKKFTIELYPGYYRLYTFLWILKNSQNNKRKE